MQIVHFISLLSFSCIRFLYLILCLFLYWHLINYTWRKFELGTQSQCPFKTKHRGKKEEKKSRMTGAAKVYAQEYKRNEILKCSIIHLLMRHIPAKGVKPISISLWLWLHKSYTLDNRPLCWSPNSSDRQCICFFVFVCWSPKINYLHYSITTPRLLRNQLNCAFYASLDTVVYRERAWTLFDCKRNERIFLCFNDNDIDDANDDNDDNDGKQSSEFTEFHGCFSEIQWVAGAHLLSVLYLVNKICASKLSARWMIFEVYGKIKRYKAEKMMGGKKREGKRRWKRDREREKETM